MSFPWKPTPFGPKGREQQWINTCMNAHDTFCGCDNPGDHLLLAVAQRSGYLGIKENTLTKCHHIIAGDTTDEKDPIGEDAIDGLEPGELEKLFNQDTEDDER